MCRIPDIEMSSLQWNNPVVLEQLTASAQVLLEVDVAGFELGGVDEARMLDFRLWVTKKRYLLNQTSFSVSIL